MMMHPPPPPPSQPAPITIFVHGTQIHALFKDIDVRSFFPGVTQSPAGLSPIAQLPEKHIIRKSLTALSVAQPKKFPLAGMYTFGWSGGIEVSERCNAAKKLFGLLQALSQEYNALHQASPEITLITHSHGGNVVLHMADHSIDPAPSIKRVILLACPVQERTQSYTQSPLFEKMYSLHSHHDQFQIMDQGSLQIPRTIIDTWKKNKKINISELIEALKTVSWKFGSGRHFGTQRNLIQATLDWAIPPLHKPEEVDRGLFIELALYKATHPFSYHKRGLLHTEFTTPSFFEQIPSIIQSLDEKWAITGRISHCITLSIAGS